MSKFFEYIKKYDVLILVILGIILYFPSLSYDILSYDDIPYIIQNEYLNGSLSINFHQFFIPNFVMSSIYTPLTFLVYWLIIKIFGISPFAFHFVNILFYISSTIALFYLLKKIISNYSVVFFATVLYILHPCHIECTSWISAMGYNIAGLFFFLSFLYFILGFDENKSLNYIYSIIFYIFAILSQPIAVTLPAILVLWVYCFRKERFKESIKYIFAYVPFLLFYLYLYAQTILNNYRFKEVVNYTYFEKFSIFGFDIFNSFIPINLCPIQPIPAFYFIISILIFFLFVYLFRKNNVFLFFIFFGLITIFPYLNILFNIVIPLADRYLVLYSVSSCVLISYLSFYLLEKFKEKTIVKYLSFVSFIILYLFSFLFYLPVWKNDRDFLCYAYSVNPNNEIVSVGYASLYIDDGKYEQAISLADKIILLHPSFYEGYEVKIKALKALKEKESLEKAKDICLYLNKIVSPSYEHYYRNSFYLFDIYISLQDYDSASKLLKESFDNAVKYKYNKNNILTLFIQKKMFLYSIKVDPNNFIENFRIFSNNFKLLGDNDEFYKILNNIDYNTRKEICLNYLKKYKSEYSRYVLMLLNCLYMKEIYKDYATEQMKIILNDMNRAQEFIKKGDNNSAETIYLNIISKNKYMYEAYYNLGILYLQTNRQIEAKKVFNKILEINPNDEQIQQLLNSLG